MRISKFPLPKILLLSGVLVERMILSTTLQFCKVFTRPTASSIIRLAGKEDERRHRELGTLAI